MKRPTLDEIQAVYDLIIATCEHNTEFEARGATALRTINRLVDCPASAGSPKGRDTVGGPIREADDIAVGAADAPNSPSSSFITNTIREALEPSQRAREAIARIIDPEAWKSRIEWLERADKWASQSSDDLAQVHREQAGLIVAPSLAKADAILALLEASR